MKHQVLPQPIRRLALVVAICLIVMASGIQAQDVATGSATASVLAPLAVSAAQSLAFGNVYQGVATTVANNVDASSGIFNITGQGSAGISIYFSLPGYIALADGSDRMTIGFSSTDASVDTLNGTPSTMAAASGWQNVDPNNIPAAAVIGTGGQTNIYLGGRVYPTVDQAAGAYSGDIILTVAYNGN